MAWRIRILPNVRREINGLHTSGAISRKEWIDVFNALHIELPFRARHLRGNRYAADPDCFRYVVRFRRRGGWDRYKFYVRDTLSPGLLVVEDVDYHAIP